MGATSFYDLPYPELTDPPNGPVQIKALAEAVEGTLRGDLVLGGDLTVPGQLSAPAFTFTTFNPNVYDGSTPIAKTVNHARYWRLGDLIIAQADVTVGATTSGGTMIDLPVPAALRLQNCGTLFAFGSAGTTPDGQSGMAYMATSLDRLVVVASNQAFLNCESGNTLRYSVMYPAA